MLDPTQGPSRQEACAWEWLGPEIAEEGIGIVSHPTAGGCETICIRKSHLHRI